MMYIAYTTKLLKLETQSDLIYSKALWQKSNSICNLIIEAKKGIFMI